MISTTRTPTEEDRVAIYAGRDHDCLWRTTDDLFLSLYPVADRLTVSEEAKEEVVAEEAGERATEPETESRATGKPRGEVERQRRIVRLPETKRFAADGAARTCRSAGRCACP